MQRLEEKLQATETLQPKAGSRLRRLRRLRRDGCVGAVCCGDAKRFGRSFGWFEENKKRGGSFRHELLFFGERKTCAKGKR